MPGVQIMDCAMERRYCMPPESCDRWPSRAPASPTAPSSRSACGIASRRRPPMDQRLASAHGTSHGRRLTIQGVCRPPWVLFGVNALVYGLQLWIRERQRDVESGVVGRGSSQRQSLVRDRSAGTNAAHDGRDGGANVGALFYNHEDRLERYNMADTLKSQHTAYLTKGFVCYSDMGRILCSITEDTCGWHAGARGNLYLTTGTRLLSNEGNVMLQIVADTCGRHDTLGGADHTAPARSAVIRRGVALCAIPLDSLAAGHEMRLPRRAHDAMLERIAAYWQSQLVFVAAKLGIADVLAEGPLTADEIASRVGAHAPYLRRVLRALASLGIFAADPHGRFHLNRLSQTLRSDHPESLRRFRTDAR